MNCPTLFKLLVPLALLSCAACAQQGRHIRVATATGAEIKAAAQEDNIWFEFLPGDVVPFQFLFLGVLEGGASEAPIKAKQRFYLVARKNQPMQISFDGNSFAGPQSSQWVVAVVPREKEDGGKVGWMLYLGESGRPEDEIALMMAAAPQEEATQPE